MSAGPYRERGDAPPVDPLDLIELAFRRVCGDETARVPHFATSTPVEGFEGLLLAHLVPALVDELRASRRRHAALELELAKLRARVGRTRVR